MDGKLTVDEALSATAKHALKQRADVAAGAEGRGQPGSREATAAGPAGADAPPFKHRVVFGTTFALASEEAVPDLLIVDEGSQMPLYQVIASSLAASLSGRVSYMDAYSLQYPCGRPSADRWPPSSLIWARVPRRGY